MSDAPISPEPISVDQVASEAIAEAHPAEATQAEDRTGLYPRCARHPEQLARVECDICGVFFCKECVTAVDRRSLCRDCRSRPHEFTRDLITEGHIQAIANFNILIAIGGVTSVLLFHDHPAFGQTVLRPVLVVAALFFVGVLPIWLSLNLRRYWPVGRAFQMFLSLGVLLGGGLLCINGGHQPIRIQGFLLADYNFAILYVLISSAGSSCFKPRYRDIVKDSPRLKPKLSSLYVLFFFWVVLTVVMIQDTGILEIQ